MMQEPAVIANLVKHNGERIVAKEKSVVEELEKMDEEYQAKRQAKLDAALEELRADLTEARKTVKDIENRMSALTGKKVTRIRAEGDRVCSVCGEKGHNSRRHTKEEVAAAKKKAKKEA